MATLISDTEVTINLNEALEKYDLRRNDKGPAEVTLKLSLKDLDTKEITISADQIRVTDPGYKLDDDETLKIRVRGSKSLISQLTDKDLTVTLTIPENASGLQRVTPEVKFSEKFASLAVVYMTPDEFYPSPVTRNAAAS